MQAFILPKRAGHEAQKLGFLPLTSVAAFFEQRSAGCGVAGRYSAARGCWATRGRSRRCRAMSRRTTRCRATFFHQQRYRAAFGRPRRYRAAFGHSWAPKRPFIARQRIACPILPKSPGASGFRPAAPERPARLRTATPGRPTRHRPTLRPAFRAAHLRRHPTSSAKIAKYNPRICVM